MNKKIIKKLMIALFLFIIFGVILYLPIASTNGIERFMMMFVSGTFLWIFICILVFYIKSKVMQGIYKSKKTLVQQRHEVRKTTNLQPKQVLDPSYENAKTAFNCAMKNGQLKREDILDVKRLLSTILGNSERKYDKYYFKNDAHEIYVKLKDGNLNVLDYQRVVDLLIDKASKNN